MRKCFLVTALAVLIGATIAVGGQKAEAVNISGTWLFSVDLASGGHGDPTFVFKQDKDVLTGSYDGPLGQYKVTGTVKNNKAEFGFEFTSDGETHQAKYVGTIESSSKMSGTVNLAADTNGKWTAMKK